MSFQERIIDKLEDGTPAACSYVKLSVEEMEYYCGAGLCIVAEQEGFVFDIFYIVDDIIKQDIPNNNINAFLQEIFDKMPMKNNENINFWLCIASTGELCQPLRITPRNEELVKERIYIEVLKEISQ